MLVLYFMVKCRLKNTLPMNHLRFTDLKKLSSNLMGNSYLEVLVVFISVTTYKLFISFSSTPSPNFKEVITMHRGY